MNIIMENRHKLRHEKQNVESQEFTMTPPKGPTTIYKSQND